MEDVVIPYEVMRAFLEFFVHASVTTFRALSNTYLSSGLPSFYDEKFLEVKELIDAQQLSDARDKLQAYMPELLLSPRAHWWAAYVATELGDTATAASEQQIGDQLLRGIFSTGNGSPETPFEVLRIDDEYDILHALGKTLLRCLAILAALKRGSVRIPYALPIIR